MTFHYDTILKGKQSKQIKPFVVMSVKSCDFQQVSRSANTNISKSTITVESLSVAV